MCFFSFQVHSSSHLRCCLRASIIVISISCCLSCILSLFTMKCEYCLYFHLFRLTLLLSQIHFLTLYHIYFQTVKVFSGLLFTLIICIFSNGENYFMKFIINYLLKSTFRLFLISFAFK